MAARLLTPAKRTLLRGFRSELNTRLVKRLTMADQASRAFASKGGQQSLAILDDYASIASKHFENIPGLAKLSSYPETFNTSTSLQAQVDRLQPYSIISTMRERTAFPRGLLERLPNLKLLLTTGMRNASIDSHAARENGIVLTGTAGKVPLKAASGKHGDGAEEVEADEPPPAAFASTNQQAWALLLSLCGRIAADDAAIRNPATPSAWQSGLAIPIGGKQLGLVGFGKLGAQMARTAVLGFGMRTPVLAWSENLTQQIADERAAEVGLPPGSVKAVEGGKEELLRASDVVSLHYVLSERSKGIIGAKELACMKRSAILVNTSRGPLIDEQALLEALSEGRIRGAALDVFWEEPLGQNSPWRKADEFKSEVVLSPHMGYTNRGTMEQWYGEQAEIVRRWVAGEEVINKMN